MTKSSEMSRDAFGIAVAEQLGELRNRALAAGVPKEQLEEIITSVYGQTQDLSLSTAINRIKNAFANKIDAASATLLRGALVGSRDRVGKNIPIRYTLVTTNKQHVEISNFGTTAQYQGEKIPIPVPALVELKAKHDDEYDSWELKEIISHRPLDQAGLEKILSGLVIPIKEITKGMAYAQGHAAKPVVLAGEMNSLRAEVVFKQRDEEGKKAEVDHSLPVLMPREGAKTPEDSLPCFQFSLKGKGQGANMVRCHLSAMRHGTPLVLITDIVPLAKRCVEKHPNDPDEQAKDLNEWLKEMNVLVVGTVSTFKNTYTEDKQERNYIDVAVSCVVGIEGKFEGAGVQKPLTEAQKGAPHITTETPPIVSGQTTSSTQKAQETQPAPVAAATATQQAQTQPGAGPVRDIKQVAKMIKVWCRGSGIKPEDISLEILKAKALDMFDDDSGGTIPDAVMLEAIGFLKASLGA